MLVPIQEILDKPGKIEWRDSTAAEFMIQDDAATKHYYELTFDLDGVDGEPLPSGVFDVVFTYEYVVRPGGKASDPDTSLGIAKLGTKMASHVFASVLAILTRFTKTNAKTFQGFTFSAKEPSRRKLYRTMIRLLAPKLGLTSKQEYDAGKFLIFFIGKPNTETKAKLALTQTDRYLDLAPVGYGMRDEMRQSLTHSIAEQVANEFLAEGRLEDATRKYGTKVGADKIKALADADPSKQAKYLMWGAAQLANNKPMELVQKAVQAFHDNSKRLVKKDINTYKTPEEIADAIAALGGPTKGQERRARKDAKIKDADLTRTRLKTSPVKTEATTTANIAAYPTPLSPPIRRSPLKLRKKIKQIDATKSCGACDMIITPPGFTSFVRRELI